MDWKESMEWIKKEQAFLDTKDLKPFLISEKSISQIMDEIEEKFNEDYLLEDFIFNCMDKFDFMDYLKKRYPDIVIYEFSEYRVGL